MAEKAVTQVRVFVDDQERINRVAGLLKARTAENVTSKDVVALGLDALMAARPDLATHGDASQRQVHP